MKPFLAIPMGDPNGIGPEILLKSASHPLFSKQVCPVIFGDYDWLARLRIHLKKLHHRLTFPFFPISLDQLSGLSFRKNLYRPIPVVDFGLLKSKSLKFGKPTSWGGFASGLYIKKAVEARMQNRVDAIVTLPINKEAFKKGGWGQKYAGHTEMLAALSGSRRVALLLVSNNLRAIHVTQHIPLKEVSNALTKKRIIETVKLAHAGLRKMGIRKPRIAVCGLNPHAGDHGLFGKEEILKIAPAVQALKRSGIFVQGPFPADTIWNQVLKGKFDVGVAMYHDQGQIPVKMLGAPVVNLTLGLPFIRASVGHGTAFDIAGKGIASISSFLAAIKMVVHHFQQKKS